MENVHNDVITHLSELHDVVRQLRSGQSRVIVGIVGEPGCGKSTLTDALIDRLGRDAAIVPMDGFHLSNRELERSGLSDRKGAIETFDAAGYVNLLRRLRDPRESVVYAPEYVREIEEAVAGAIAVPAELPVVFTEGNYLLSKFGAWADVRPLLDHVWYVQSDPQLRWDRLTRRHMRFGKTEAEARSWARGSDEDNARLIRTTKPGADLIINLDIATPTLTLTDGRTPMPDC